MAKDRYRAAMKKLTAERVRLERSRANKGQGMAQKELARRIGVHPSELSRWESGENLVPLPAAYRIADALKVDVGAILPPPEYVAAELARMEREGA